MKFIVVEKLGQSAIVTIDNAPANTLGLDVLAELESTVKSLSNDENIRALVVTGAGDRFFCSGADLNMFTSGDKEKAAQVIDAFDRSFAAIRNFDGVTVAAINGYALGGGLELALCCDYMVAEQGALMGLPEARVGLIPCAGGTKMLADKVGKAWAKRIVLGGETVDARKGFEIGLLEEIVDPGFAKIVAVSLAEKIGGQGTAAVAAARQLIDNSNDVTLMAQLEAERSAFLQLTGSAEQLEGVQAFIEKRKPIWCTEDDD